MCFFQLLGTLQGDVSRSFGFSLFNPVFGPSINFDECLCSLSIKLVCRLPVLFELFLGGFGQYTLFNGMAVQFRTGWIFKPWRITFASESARPFDIPPGWGPFSADGLGKN
jgi:hypothetical protein